MTINRLSTLSILISLSSSMALIGCQTAPTNNPSATIPNILSIDIENWSPATPQPQLLQTLTRYEWQLTHIKGSNNKVKPMKAKAPLLMAVRPNLLLFQEGCQRYRMFFNETFQSPYLYNLSRSLDSLPDECENSAQNVTQSITDATFNSKGNVDFTFIPQPTTSFSKSNTKNMALVMNDGVTLLFTGTPKSEQKTSDLPITNALLERYHWRLITATDDKNQQIDDFTETDAPITGGFYTDTYRQLAGFSVGCNGTGGPYALSINNTLLIGGGPSTMISCGKKLDDIQSKFGRLVTYSVSTLTLTMQNKGVNTQTDNQILPSYLLTQKFDIGKTLVWKNEERSQP